MKAVVFKSDQPSWCLELSGISAAETKLSAGDGNGDVVALLARGLKDTCTCHSKKYYMPTTILIKHVFVWFQHIEKREQ